MRTFVICAAMVLALLPSLPSGAGAQSPWWVLWRRTLSPSGYDAVAEAAFESRAECETKAKQVRQQMPPPRSSELRENLLCFPAGVTPLASLRYGGGGGGTR